jgi:Mrp family chromosome partitioning ATPase
MANPKRTKTESPANTSGDSTSDGKVHVAGPTPDSGETLSKRNTADMTSQAELRSPGSAVPVRTATPAKTLLLATMPVPSGSGSSASGRPAGVTIPARTATPTHPVISLPGAVNDAVAVSSSVRTIVVSPGGSPVTSAGQETGAAATRKVTPARGVVVQTPARPASFSPPATPTGAPSAGQEGSNVQAWMPPSARSPLADSGGGVQARNSALVMRIATPLSPLPSRPSPGWELIRRGGEDSRAELLPAQLRPTRFVPAEQVDSRLPLLQKEGAHRAAAFRALRRRLAEQGNPGVILVTSAQDGEGKSTCAANLALAMAESGRLKVLLVEANLRRPKLAEIFGFQPSRCLIEQLAAHREQIDAPWLTTEIQPSGLHVLATSSEADRDQVLHGPSFSAAVARWRLAFDHVVVDGPAILSSCDASIIHDAVDAVVMVALAGATRNLTIRRALDQISADMVAGLVLMDSLDAR